MLKFERNVNSCEFRLFSLHSGCFKFRLGTNGTVIVTEIPTQARKSFNFEPEVGRARPDFHLRGDHWSTANNAFFCDKYIGQTSKETDTITQRLLLHDRSSLLCYAVRNIICSHRCFVTYMHQQISISMSEKTKGSSDYFERFDCDRIC